MNVREHIACLCCLLLAPAVNLAGQEAPEAPIPPIETGLEGFLSSDEPVDIFVLLRDQPQEDIARKHLDPIRAELKALHQQVAANLRKRGAMEPGLASLVAKRNGLEIEARRSAIREIREVTGPAQDRVAAKLRAIGARPGQRFWTFNMIEATAPGNLIPAIAAWPEVMTVKRAHRRTTLVESSVQATNIGGFWDAGYLGATQTVLVLDSGINAAHPSFSGLPVVARVKLESASKRDCFDDNAGDPADLFNHGTAVSAIIGGRNPKGMLPELGQLVSMKVVAKAKDIAACPPMLIEEADWIAGAEEALGEFPIQVINISLGGNPGTEDDLGTWVVDRLAVMFDLSIFVAAGNNGESPRLYQVNSPAAGYNVIAVAAVDANRTQTRIDNSPASYSSRGPTPRNRAKPDIACPGSRIISADGRSDGPSQEISGTSFASPHCAGIGAAMADAGIRGALERKALLLNSTDTARWSREVGFGEANAERAMQQKDLVFANTLTLRPGRFVGLYAGELQDNVRATLVWNRHIRSIEVAGNSASWYLTNLNLNAYGASLRDPYVYTSVGDNVERIEVAGTGQVVFKVSVPPNTVVNADEEPYAVAFSAAGFRPVRGPELQVSCVPDRTDVMVFGTINFDCAIRNTGDLDLPPAANAGFAYLDPWTRRVVSSDLGAGIAAGQQVTRRISLKPLAGATQGTTKLEFAAASTAYGETWLREDSTSFNVVVPALQDCTPQSTVNATFPLSPNLQNFTVDLKFPKFNPRNPGVCEWRADPGGFVSVINSAGSGVTLLNGEGDRQLTFRVTEAPQNSAATRSATITIRITSAINERNAPAPTPVNPPITINVTQQYRPR